MLIDYCWDLRRVPLSRLCVCRSFPHLLANLGCSDCLLRHVRTCPCLSGPERIVGTLLLGTVFGLVRILYDTLVPVVFWHAAVDIVAGYAGKRYLVENK